MILNVCVEYMYIYIYNVYSAVKRLIAINRIQNKKIKSHKICMCTMCIYYFSYLLCKYKYTHMHVRI